MKHKRKNLNKTALDCLIILHSIGGCHAVEDWDRGWDEAINTAIELIAKKYQITMEELMEWIEEI